MVFATTDHCGTIQILDKNIVPEFLLYALNRQKIDESFNRSFRASVTNMKKFKIKIPVKSNGGFDVKKQGTIAKYFIELEEKNKELQSLKDEFSNAMNSYLKFSCLQ